MTRNLRTSDYSQSARERLAEAIARARRAAGHRFRPSFAREAGISKRSLEAVELNDASVGISILEDIGRALGRHFAEWTVDTPRLILDGGSIPSLEPASPPELIDLNEEVLDDLRALREELMRLGERAEGPVMRFLESREPDRDKRMRTWNAFITEVRQQQEGGGT